MGANDKVEHYSTIMQRVHTFYNLEKFTDVLFKFPFSDYSFTAHRLILAAACPYLSELFENVQPDCSSITITTMDSDTFEQLVIFCYAGRTDISAGNAEKMLRGANLLQLQGVIDVCVNYMMDHIGDFLVRKLITLEAEIKCKPLETRLLDYIVKNFKMVNQNRELFGLTSAQWKVIIGKKRSGREATDLVLAIKSWYEYNKSMRQQQVPELFGSLPLFVVNQNRELFGLTSAQWKVIIDKVDINEVSQADLFWAIKSWYEYNVSSRQQKLPEVIGSLSLTEFDKDFILKQIKPLPGCEEIANEALKKKGDMVTWLAIQVWEEQWTGPKHILRFDQAKEEWNKTINLELKRYGFETAFIEDTLYFFGGQGTSSIINHNQSYNLRTKEFSTKAGMLERRTTFCGAVWGQYVYAIAGINHKREDLNTVERYDTTTNRWEYVASMPSRRHSAGVTMYNGEIYIIGGRNNVVAQDTVECYNPATNKWRTCKSMIEKTASPSVTVHQDYIYAVSRNNKSFTTVQRYDPKSNEWTMIASFNVNRIYVCAVSIGNQLFALGGINGSNGPFSDTVEVYDMANNKWLTKQKLPVTGMYECHAVPTNLAENL